MTGRQSRRKCAPAASVRPARTDRGAVAVEFALIVPILAMLLLGTVTTGVSYSRALSITNAVREGSRFGATADASSASWKTNVLARVRTTQFDPSGAQTSICVQLWKQGTGAISANTGCDLGSGPALSPPASSTANPAVPSGVSTGQCVVRVTASRTFTINLAVFGTINRTMTRYAVARYEGQTCG